MDILKTIRQRRSVRDFKAKEIPEGVMNKLIESLIWAPSAGNLQSRKFYLVKDDGLKKKLVNAALGQSFIALAPLVVVGCTDSRISYRYGERGVYLYCIQDVALSIMGMMLVAVEEGLSSTWVGAFHEEDVSRALDLPTNLRPVAIVPVGYPERVPEAPLRVSKAEAVEFR
jgi:nitroreductase